MVFQARAMPEIMITGHIKTKLPKLRIQPQPGDHSVREIVSVSQKCTSHAEFSLGSTGGQVAGVNHNSRDLGCPPVSKNFADRVRQSAGSLVAVREGTADMTKATSARNKSAPPRSIMDNKRGSEMGIGDVHQRADEAVHSPISVSQSIF